jgi:hypothetical protein
MKRKASALSRSYQAALDRYLKRGPAATLQPAARLGHQAVVLDLEILELALMHEQALLAHVLPGSSPAVIAGLSKRAALFFAKTVTPMEETRRTALQANRHLHRLNQALNQRTLALAASNRELQKEIVQRQRVEKNLRQSEQRYSQLLEQSRRQQEQLRHLSRQILQSQEEA